MKARGNANKRLHLVFDLMDILVIKLTNKDIINEIYLQWFVDNNLIIDVDGPYLLFPGAPELFQYLFKNGIKVSFFLDLPEEFGKRFVEKFLIHTLGQEHYEKVKEKVLIKSKNDMTLTTKENNKIKSKIYSLYSEQFEKNLNIFREADNTLDEIILIDNRMYVHAKDVRNFLHVLSALIYDFASWAEPQERIFYRINHLFYVVGMLANAFDKPSIPVADHLFAAQFKRISVGKYEPQFYDADIKYDIYERGLSELRKEVDSDLEFLELKHMQPFLSLYKEKLEKKRIEENRKRKIQDEIDLKAYEESKKKYLRPMKIEYENDFYQALSLNTLMIDKTATLAKMLDSSTWFKVFVGPSCGKTFNLSMLRYFLDKSTVNTEKKCSLANFNISHHKKKDELLGHFKKYSIMYLDFSDVNATCYEQLKVLLHQKMSQLYQQYAYLRKNISLKKFDEEHFDAIVGKAFSKYALVGSLIFLAEIIREDNQNKGEEKYDRPVLIINDYDRLMSPQYLAEKNNEGFNLLQRFFGGLKDCKHFEFVIMTAQEKVPTLLPTNCSHYEAVSEFACTSVEAMKFFNQHHIDVTLEALNQLSFYYCVDKTRYGKNAEYIAKLKSKGFNQMQKHPDFYINTTERWYHPQTLINYVKEKMLDKTLDMTESKNKIFHLPVMSKSPHRLHSFFDLPHHKACDEKEKNVIAADTEVSQQGNVLTPRKC